MAERTGSDIRVMAGEGSLALPNGASRLAAFVRGVDGAGLLLLWACIGLARGLPHVIGNEDVTDPLVAVLALPMFVIVPRQIGVLLRPLVGRWFGGPGAGLDAIESYVAEWLVGLAALTMGLAVLTGVARVPAELAAIDVVVVVTASGLLFGWRDAANGAPRTSHGGGLLARGWPFLATVAMAAVPLALVRANQPYPLQVGWGLFNFNFRVLQFVEADHIALTPGLHTPVHSSVLGVASIITGAATDGLLWAAPLLLYPAYALGVYLVLRRLTDSRLVALAGVWVSLWILSITTFQHLHALGMRGVVLTIWPWALLLMLRQVPAIRARQREAALYVIVPVTVMAMLMVVRWYLPTDAQPWALLALAVGVAAALSRFPEHVRPVVGLLTLVVSVMTFVHIIEGPVFYGLSLVFILLLAWRPDAVPSRAVLGVAFLAIVGFIVAQEMGSLTFDDPSMISRMFLGDSRADAILLPFDRKLDLFHDGMTPVFLALLGLSAARLMIWPNPTHLAAVGTVAVATFLYFLPESGLHRALGPAIPLIGLSVALELSWFATRAAAGLARLRRPSMRLAGSPVAWTAALVFVGLVALTPPLTTSLREQTGMSSIGGFPVPRTEGNFSDVTPGEYRAASWIRGHLPDDWAMVSDPATMFFMEGLTFNPQVVEKRAWIAPSEYTEEDLARMNSLSPLVFRAANIDAALRGMVSLTEGHDGAVLVITTRTMNWYTDPETLFHLGRPFDLRLEAEPIASFCGYYDISPCLDRFFATERLTPVYNEGGVAILVPDYLEGRLEVHAADEGGQ